MQPGVGTESACHQGAYIRISSHWKQSVQEMILPTLRIRRRGRCAVWQTFTPKPWWFSSEKQDAEWTLTAPVCNYRFHAYDGLLNFGHVGDVVFIGAQLPLLYSFIDSHHHVSGDVCSVIHTWNRSRDITQGCTHPRGLLLCLNICSVHQNVGWLL